jgi:hypothetical protein
MEARTEGAHKVSRVRFNEIKKARAAKVAGSGFVVNYLVMV